MLVKSHLVLYTLIALSCCASAGSHNVIVARIDIQITFIVVSIRLLV